MFGSVKLTKNADINKYKYSGYGIGFDGEQTFSFPGSGFGCNVIIFGVDMSSSVDNKKKYILIPGEGPMQGLDGTTLTAEKRSSINLPNSNKKFCLSLHYNGATCYWFANGREIINLKAKDSEIAATPLCLGNLSKDFCRQYEKDRMIWICLWF